MVLLKEVMSASLFRHRSAGAMDPGRACSKPVNRAVVTKEAKWVDKATLPARWPFDKHFSTARKARRRMADDAGGTGEEKRGQVAMPQEFAAISGAYRDRLEVEGVILERSDGSGVALDSSLRSE
jgi:hypothetical protein